MLNERAAWGRERRRKDDILFFFSRGPGFGNGEFVIWTIIDSSIEFGWQ